MSHFIWLIAIIALFCPWPFNVKWELFISLLKEGFWIHSYLIFISKSGFQKLLIVCTTTDLKNRKIILYQTMQNLYSINWCTPKWIFEINDKIIFCIDYYHWGGGIRPLLADAIPHNCLNNRKVHGIKFSSATFPTLKHDVVCRITFWWELFLHKFLLKWKRGKQEN